MTFKPGLLCSLVFGVAVFSGSIACSGTHFSLPVESRERSYPHETSQCVDFTKKFRTRIRDAFSLTPLDELNQALTDFQKICGNGQMEVYGVIRYDCSFLFEENVEQALIARDDDSLK